MGARVAVISNTADKQDEAEELGAEYFINTHSKKPSEGLQAWDGGRNIILATAPSSHVATDAIPGLAPDRTLVVLGVGAGDISAAHLC